MYCYARAIPTFVVLRVLKAGCAELEPIFLPHLSGTWEVSSSLLAGSLQPDDIADISHGYQLHVFAPKRRIFKCFKGRRMDRYESDYFNASISFPRILASNFFHFRQLCADVSRLVSVILEGRCRGEIRAACTLLVARTVTPQAILSNPASGRLVTAFITVLAKVHNGIQALTEAVEGQGQLADDAEFFLRLNVFQDVPHLNRVVFVPLHQLGGCSTTNLTPSSLITSRHDFPVSSQ